MIALALVVIFLAAVIWIARPLARPPGDPSVDRSEPAQELEARYEGLLLALQDLDFELQTGKLSPEDHAGMRQRIQHEAVQLLRRLDEARSDSVKHQRIAGR